MPQESFTNQLVNEYASSADLYAARPAPTRRFLDQQASDLIRTLGTESHAIHFLLPNQVVLEGGEVVPLPASLRRRSIGFLIKPASRTGRLQRVRSHLDAMQKNFHPGLAACARLLRFAVAHTILHQLLPDGRAVHYQAETEDDIPSIPQAITVPAAVLAARDAVVEGEGFTSPEPPAQVPFVETARQFFLPQWVAFDEQDRLLARGLPEAESSIASLENAILLLQQAVAIFPAVVSDPLFQHKHSGLLGQLVNQGRAMARFQTRIIVEKIRSRAAQGALNRGFSLTLRYFDDAALSLRCLEVDVIPAGRIRFVPAFVVLAMQHAAERVLADPQYNPSTRRHLLSQLATIQLAFDGQVHS